jgi:hypothetical protein
MPVDYSAYRSWSWQQLPVANAWIRSEELQYILSGALDQRGLRPAVPPTGADLKVRAETRLERRMRQSNDDYPPYYAGYPARPDFYGYRGNPNAPGSRVYEEDVMVVHIELFDGRTGAPIWDTRAEMPCGGAQSEQTKVLRRAVQQALSSFPPA